MTAIMRHRGFRFVAPSCFAACKAVTNAVLIDGGRTTRHCPPPVGLQSLLLKCNLFSPRRVGSRVPMADHRNGHQSDSHPPLGLWGRIPQSEGLHSPRGGTSQKGFRGVTHRVTYPTYPKGATPRKRGDAKGTPPQTLVFVFLAQVISCCSYLYHIYAYDCYIFSPFVAQGWSAPWEKGVQSSQHAVVVTTLLTLHHTTTTLAS